MRTKYEIVESGAYDDTWDDVTVFGSAHQEQLDRAGRRLRHRRLAMRLFEQVSIRHTKGVALVRDDEPWLEGAATDGCGEALIAQLNAMAEKRA